MIFIGRTKTVVVLGGIFLSILSKQMSVQAFMTIANRHLASQCTGTLLHAESQAEYGKSLEMPSTYVTCGQCGSSYALKKEDLGGGTGRRLECSVCGHAWFQSQNRIMELGDNFEMVELPERDMKRIQMNIEEGKSPKFVGAMKLYVGNIAFGCTEEDLWDTFEKVGSVGEVSLVRDDQGRNRGFAFITMRDTADGEKAMAELDGLELNGRALSVRESNN
ncbi:RNP-1 like RNA-binding protein [Nitzschia inconspicua]|uniref:RNP-1 like RNA-binding protein n=1 Tax=Nitzschia inconspicua TaxID=303405 RepID=A0A9K3PSW4_9STRA|nr:RNP-1 like RNA-binding protein [Nitzschia inconspicua]